MRKPTNHRHGFPGAVVITVITVAVMVLLAGAMLTDGFGEGGVFLDGVVLVYALLFLAVAVGVIAALVQRRREIKGGEEDEAKNTETQARRKRQAIVSALVNGCLFAATAAVLLWARHTAFPTGPMSVVLLVLAVIDAVSLIPLALSLRVRLKEINGGELDEASQY